MNEAPEPSQSAQILPYGEWESSISPMDLTKASVNYSNLIHHDGMLYWIESRPLEGGRNVLVRRMPDGSNEDITPADFNVRSTVHEYGGAPYQVSKGVIYFSNFADQRLYRQRPGEPPAPISPASPLRFANCAADDTRERLICVREDHRQLGEPVNNIVALSMNPSDPEENEGTVLFTGSDFVSNPTLSPDGSRLAWLSWDHPNMPWDSVQLWWGEIDGNGVVTKAQQLNPDADEAVMQPEWLDNDRLLAISDRDEWWNFYEFGANGVRRVNDHDIELGGPAWALGSRFFQICDDGRIATYYNEGGTEGIALVNQTDGSLQKLALGVVQARSPVLAGTKLFFVAGFADRPSAIVEADINDSELRHFEGKSDAGMSADDVSEAQAVSFPTSGGQRAHGFYYPPTNGAFAAPEGELPPVIVKAHGGPTGHATPAFSKGTQFWTSRGFAVFDLNYRGSTGFGRPYRRALYPTWGEADVDDAVAAADHLVSQKLADPERLAIRGGSAGGFLVLATLAFKDTFRAGANYFGIADFEVLAKGTHKFESRYLDSLIGPYPEERTRYQARSPINALEGFDQPLITLQGLDDKVVPPDQSELIVSALREKGVPVAYLPFEGEQHGFRKAENIARAHEAELYFYGRVLGFTPAGKLTPIAIDNLD